MPVVALRGDRLAAERPPRAKQRTRSASHSLAERLAGERGQAAVEFVLVLPFLVTLLFVIFELAIVLSHSLTLNDIASQAARAAAVWRFNGAASACQAANNSAPATLGGQPVTVSCSGSNTPGSAFTVTVSTAWNVGLPLISFSTGGQLTSSATEKLE
jgi:Flp pilus assembly protein TadG